MRLINYDFSSNGSGSYNIKIRKQYKNSFRDAHNLLSLNILGQLIFSCKKIIKK